MVLVVEGIEFPWLFASFQGLWAVVLHTFGFQLGIGTATVLVLILGSCLRVGHLDPSGEACTQIVRKVTQSLPRERREFICRFAMPDPHIHMSCRHDIRRQCWPLPRPSF